MKHYQRPTVEIYELTADESLAAVIRSEPVVEDNDEELSV